MSAIPMPTSISSPYVAIAPSHLMQSVSTRLYTRTKSYTCRPEATGSTTSVSSAKAVRVPTAPRTAVIPALFKNALRLSPFCCSIHDLLVRIPSLLTALTPGLAAGREGAFSDATCGLVRRTARSGDRTRSQVPSGSSRYCPRTRTSVVTASSASTCSGDWLMME